MDVYIPNELDRYFLNLSGLNTYAGEISSPRGSMHASHLSQALVIQGSTERFHQTGMEYEYGKRTFKIEMPVDARILKVIHRYPKRAGISNIKHNPQSIVVYENAKTSEVNYLNITDYCSYHQYFGFEYASTPAAGLLYEGANIPAGTVFRDSPSITPSGGYRYGTELNVAYMSHPAVSEDGVLFNRDSLWKLGFYTYEVREIEFGSKYFPLNLYGDDTNYKAFPDIGDVIPDNGVLMALREFNTDLAWLNQSVKAVQKIDHENDKLFYAEGGGGEVIDIQIYHDHQNPQAGLPPAMEEQAMKYENASLQFCQDILNLDTQLHRQRGEKYKRSPEFSILVTRCLAKLEHRNSNAPRITILYHGSEMDLWRIKFVIRYHLIPTNGNKVTDLCGGKGVITKVVDASMMPVDKDGNRADVVMDPNATINRMNPARKYEQFVNACSRDAVKHIRQELELGDDDRNLQARIEAFEKANPERFERVWQYLLGFYKIVSPERQYKWLTTGMYRESRAYLLAHELVDRNTITRQDGTRYPPLYNIHKYMPPENEPEVVNIAKQLAKNYRPTLGPVTFMTDDGRSVTTKTNVLIAPQYFILLEKIADDFSAVSSGKFQAHGVLAQVSGLDKYSKPVREQNVRTDGEAEQRNKAAHCGPRSAAEIQDRNNSPLTHHEMCLNLYKSETPTNVENLVDRKKIPYGGSKSLQLVKHVAICSGWTTAYRPYVPSWKQEYKQAAMHFTTPSSKTK